MVPSYFLRVQGWYRRTSRGTAVPPEGTHMVPSCLLDAARGCIIHSLRKSGRTLGLGLPLLGRETAPNCQNIEKPKSKKKKKCPYRGTSAKTTPLETTPLETTPLGTRDLCLFLLDFRASNQGSETPAAQTYCDMTKTFCNPIFHLCLYC